jgi:hypothetical protein
VCDYISQANFSTFSLMAISLFERHTGENMFDLLVRFLDPVIPSWRTKCIAVSTDGARSMTGRCHSIPPNLRTRSSSHMVRLAC